MTLTTRWRKSSCSGGGEGNDRVEIAELDSDTAVRDAKTPPAPLSVRARPSPPLPKG
ncbi:DUF397 domain-containing protein [Streptomyces sp. NPDC085927]|uniref:DUF397 domain-containing protein n=1 Tax=Streptomyces sp. NPDC085927 TaxID=3365738 RepID=UPI0037CF0DE9